MTIVAFFVINKKSAYNALLERDWIHSNWVVTYFLYEVIMFWKDNNNIEVVADDKPFATCNNVHALLYNEHVGIMHLSGNDNNWKQILAIVGMPSLDKSTSNG